MPTISETGAAWLHDLNLDRVSPAVIEDIKLRILDAVGVMLAGSTDEVVAKVRRSVRESAGVPDGGEICDLTSLPLVLGVMAHILEFDDTHQGSAIHVSSPVVAAALPAAQRLRSSGREFIAAVLGGNELTCRLGLIAPGMLHKKGYHPTGVVGIFGAAFALSKLLHRDVEQTVNAVGLCGSFSAALMASWVDGTSAKSLHAGWAAASATSAVAFANSGITGPRAVFENRFGFFPAHVQEPGYQFRLAGFEEGLGSAWEVPKIFIKVFPCGHYIQPFVDAALKLQARHAIRAEDVARIEISIADFMVPLVCEPVPEKRRPNTVWHARFSVQHSIAEALYAGKMDKNSYRPDTLADPRIQQLADKVDHRVDPAADTMTAWFAEVAIELNDGSRFHYRDKFVRGGTEDPGYADEVIGKFTRNAEGVIPSRLIEETIDRVLRLEQCDDVTAVFGRLELRA